MEEDLNTVEIEFGPCCFCGESILSTNTDPCRLTVETSKGSWQTWFCHGECFKEKIVEHPLDLSPTHVLVKKHDG